MSSAYRTYDSDWMMSGSHVRSTCQPLVVDTYQSLISLQNLVWLYVNPDRGYSAFPRNSMPYYFNAALPAPVRNHLPEHAQNIYRNAFNRAYAAHAGESRQEEIAHRIAWAAVKRSYVKRADTWGPRDQGSGKTEN
jgi:cation transport regulator